MIRKRRLTYLGVHQDNQHFRIDTIGSHSSPVKEEYFSFQELDEDIKGLLAAYADVMGHPLPLGYCLEF